VRRIAHFLNFISVRIQFSDIFFALPGRAVGSYIVQVADIFEYTDPVDGSVTKNQGIRFVPLILLLIACIEKHNLTGFLLLMPVGGGGHHNIFTL
jgi:hypothetical protein